MGPLFLRFLLFHLLLLVYSYSFPFFLPCTPLCLFRLLLLHCMINSPQSRTHPCKSQLLYFCPVNQFPCTNIHRTIRLRLMHCYMIVLPHACTSFSVPF